MPDALQAALLLEDDESSRFVLKTILERAGFKVLASAQAAEAIEICGTHPEGITIMISDVVLRGSGGPEAVRQFRALQPGMAVLFISGFPLELLENRRILDSRDMAGERMDFLQKPFTVQRLLSVVDELIGRR